MQSRGNMFRSIKSSYPSGQRRALSWVVLATISVLVLFIFVIPATNMNSGPFYRLPRLLAQPPEETQPVPLKNEYISEDDIQENDVPDGYIGKGDIPEGEATEGNLQDVTDEDEQVVSEETEKHDAPEVKDKQDASEDLQQEVPEENFEHDVSEDNVKPDDPEEDEVDVQEDVQEVPEEDEPEEDVTASTVAMAAKKLEFVPEPTFKDTLARHQWCEEKYGDPTRFKVVTVPRSLFYESFTMAVYSSNDVVSDSIAKHGSWEIEETRELFTVYSAPESMEGKVLVDIGANVGWFTLVALAKGYKVIAFEPDNRNLQLISLSACLNEGFAERLVVYPFGLSKETKKCYVMSADSNLGDGHTVCSEEEVEQVKKHPTIKYEVRSEAQFYRLDDILLDETNGTQPPAVGVMKIDIEGHEIFALSEEGAGRLFKNSQTRPKVVFAELFHCQQDRCEDDREFAELMFGRGYNVLRVPIKSNQVFENGQMITKPTNDFSQLTSQHVINVVFTDESRYKLQA